MGSGANGGSPNLAFITGFPTPSPRMNRPPAAWSSCAAPLPGYLNDPEATARSLTTDGFYRTGDVGTIGADGYLTIVDRLSDLVITGGENVYPAEVEAVPKIGRASCRERV